MATFSGSGLTCLRGENLVFRDLDFTVAGGGALVLVGPNGSGKSSLLRMLAGLLGPAAGTLTWDGEAVTDEPDEHHARLHYVGHHDCVKPILTVAENLAFWARLHGSAATSEDRLERALHSLDVGHLRDVPGRFLSAGQKRRVNLARVVAVPAPLWLLDEPATALDRASVGRLNDAIAAHRAAGGLVVVSTHQDLGLDDPTILDLADFPPGPAPGVAI